MLRSTLEEDNSVRAVRGRGVDVKVVFLGNSEVGKTSLLNRFLKNQFGATQATVGVAFGSKVVFLEGGQRVSLGLWDTGGMERFDSLNTFYCRKAQVAVLCFDLKTRESFAKIDKWHRLVMDQAEPGCLVALVGCQLDTIEMTPDGKSNRAVPVFECEAKAAALGGKYFETSAKTGTNVGQLFTEIVNDYAETKLSPSKLALGDDMGHYGGKPISLNGNTDEPRSWSSCCTG